MSDNVVMDMPKTEEKSYYMNLSEVDGGKSMQKKIPRRIIHFSDGIVEEYSTDEEDEAKPLKRVTDPKTLAWLPRTWFYVRTAALMVYSVADLCGKKLAWFLGITRPKYQRAIYEYKRLKAAEDNNEVDEQLERSVSRTTLNTVLCGSIVDVNTGTHCPAEE